MSSLIRLKELWLNLEAQSLLAFLNCFLCKTNLNSLNLSCSLQQQGYLKRFLSFKKMVFSARNNKNYGVSKV